MVTVHKQAALLPARRPSKYLKHTHNFLKKKNKKNTQNPHTHIHSGTDNNGAGSAAASY